MSAAVYKVGKFSAVAAYREQRDAAGSAYVEEQFCPEGRRSCVGTGYRVGLASSTGTPLSQEWFMKLRENGSDLERFV